jgi:hypothetical protein
VARVNGILKSDKGGDAEKGGGVSYMTKLDVFTHARN